MNHEDVLSALLEHTHFRTNSVGKRRYFPGEKRTHRSSDSLAVLMDGGEAWVESEGTSFQAKAGDLVLFPMETPFTTSTDGGFSLRYIEFDLFISDHRSLVFRLIRKNLLPDYLQSAEGRVLGKAVDQAIEGRSFSRAFLNGALTVCVSQTLDLKKLSDPELEDARAMKLFAPVLNIIRQRFHERLTVKSLAEMTGLTESYFCASFKKTFGVSPLQYLLRVKMYSAQKLLREGRYTVAEVAQRTGFEDHATFTRAFKRIYRVAPGRISSLDERSVSEP